VSLSLPSFFRIAKATGGQAASATHPHISD
jgi:hypothetical protein